ncbi:pseudaminic acid synthase [Oceanirhabdus sp. W0125-5]|uniref:pseudaminic acid synthase n=1 Tax=Oceanirhabdus sp. W0125-5 TaxID=2999116 RepID=UPI0022F2C1B7|nr:pseudaminic acid synthase [Oceanirhabdus sp. W0125-5]WBW96219.1 pseudaminic acid synthase [Oceanirhabdus sp. W0125-5]
MKAIKIGNKLIGNDNPVFIIAEVSANHGHDIEIVKKMVRAAKEAGADAIKLQTYTADTLTIDCNNDYFKIKQGTLWDGRYLYDLYKEAYMPWEWHKEIFDYANSLDIICFSTPFDFSAVDYLEKLNVPAYKIASFEITDIPLIEYAASKAKPMILSTGIATIQEIQEAVEACKRMGNNNIILLKCTSAYPAPLEEMNLKTIPNLSETFNVVAGLSDHSMGTTVPVASVAIGAKVIEKHFILDKKIGGPDAAFSLDLDELKEMIKSVREVEVALGSINYTLSNKTLKNREFSRSLFIVEDVKAGEEIKRENLRSIRPGYGLAPKYYYDVIGKRFKEDYKKGTPLKWEYIK